uniref:Putative Phospholipase A2 n=1 Tax=Megacormus gertschi TaxID=1843536 RepID=A0A224XBL2_9SCOR
MAALFYTVLATMVIFCVSHTSQRELYVNYEPQLNHRDSRPAVRAAVINLGSEEGREVSECRMLNSMDEIAREINSFPDYTIKRTSKEEMDFLEKRCSQSPETERWEFVYKGTKWCGIGNIAENESDLGPLEVDKCCWTHDHCDNIASSESKYGLENNYYYTLLNCDCEEAFDKCLQEVANKTKGEDKEAAILIRKYYFERFSHQCYRLYCRNGRFDRSDNCANKHGIWKSSYEEW